MNLPGRAAGSSGPVILRGRSVWRAQVIDGQSSAPLGPRRRNASVPACFPMVSSAVRFAIATLASHGPVRVTLDLALQGGPHDRRTAPAYRAASGRAPGPAPAPARPRHRRHRGGPMGPWRSGPRPRRHRGLPAWTSCPTPPPRNTSLYPADPAQGQRGQRRLAAGRVARRGVEDVDQHVVLRHGIDGRRGTDEVDPELLVGLGPVVGQGLWAAEMAGTCVEDGQVEGELTVQPDVPVEDVRIELNVSSDRPGGHCRGLSPASDPPPASVHGAPTVFSPRASASQSLA
jgi:hypothetical protein